MCCTVSVSIPQNLQDGSQLNRPMIHRCPLTGACGRLGLSQSWSGCFGEEKLTVCTKCLTAFVQHAKSVTAVEQFPVDSLKLKCYSHIPMTGIFWKCSSNCSAQGVNESPMTTHTGHLSACTAVPSVFWWSEMSTLVIKSWETVFAPHWDWISWICITLTNSWWDTECGQYPVVGMWLEYEVFISWYYSVRISRKACGK
jgi:hypothetical protein